MEVRIEKLVKIFESRGNKKVPVVAVNNMTFDIPDGKLCGLLGPSGCGKSTTLYMIAGLHKITEGHIYFGDEDVTNVPAENRGIGLVFQNYALYPHLNVRQNIMFPLDNIRPKLSYDEKCAIALENAKIVDIDRYLDRKPKELSGGQQQRVAIARALAKRPRVLLLDEPLSNLDARLRLQTREEIKRIQKQTGITTVFVTHDQEEAMSISDFIVVMKDGIVQQKDEPQKVYEEPANLFVAKFLGTPAINTFSGNIVKDVVYIGGNKVAKDANLKKVHIEEVLCPNCGNVVPHNAKYCNLCGTNLLEGGTLAKGKKEKVEKVKASDNGALASLVVPATADREKAALIAKLKKYARPTDTLETIELFNALFPDLDDENDYITACDVITVKRTEEELQNLFNGDDYSKSIVDAAIAELKEIENPSSKEGLVKTQALVRRSANRIIAKDYAERINGLFVESDWEATKQIKETQLEMIYNVEDIENPETVEKINNIINNLETRLNPERDCVIGIRAEHFELDSRGPIHVKVENIEHIGRDISVVGSLVETNEPIKIIISSELAKQCEGKEVLNFKPKRIYVFEKTGERIL
jgi:multiple sugar transport system ATP-binding protein